MVSKLLSLFSFLLQFGHGCGSQFQSPNHYCHITQLQFKMD
jgi:hypothetical protein